MILTLCYVLSVFAQTTPAISMSNTPVSTEASSAVQTVTFSAQAQAVSTISAPGREVVNVTITEKPSCSPTATVTVTTTPVPKKETLCVKCYDKIINTPDCKKCSMTCEDGTKIDSVNSDKMNNCPNRDPKEVPCPCKDDHGRVIPDNYYRSSGLISKDDFSELTGNISN